MSKHPLGSSPETWRGPMPSAPSYQSCGQRCPDCQQIVNVAGTWGDWDRIHGAVCTKGQMVLPIDPEGDPT